MNDLIKKCFDIFKTEKLGRKNEADSKEMVCKLKTLSDSIYVLGKKGFFLKKTRLH